MTERGRLQTQADISCTGPPGAVLDLEHINARHLSFSRVACHCELYLVSATIESTMKDVKDGRVRKNERDRFAESG